MAYQIEFKRSAARQLRELPNVDRRRIGSAIEGLADNPRPKGVKKLSGDQDIYRIRVGDYRVVYQIKDRVLIVLVLVIANRKDVYRRR